LGGGQFPVYMYAASWAIPYISCINLASKADRDQSRSQYSKTWGNRDQSRSQYSKTSQAAASKESNEDAVGVALTLSRRLIGIVRVKHILNIEAGLEMMALGVTLSSEVCQMYC
jgi:hypothetical protein